MKRFVQKLRDKPYQEKQHILHVTTFVFAILLVVVWSFTLSSSFRDPDLRVQFDQSMEPFKDLKASVIDGYNVVSDSGDFNSQ